MRFFRPRFACALIALVAAHAQDVKDPVGPATVVVSTRAKMIAALEQAEVKLGAPIILHYRLRNQSPHTIKVASGLFNYWVMVTDASGTEPPLTREGRRRRGPPEPQTAISLSHIEPGAVDVDRSLDLRGFYELDRPGNYFVRIAQRMGIASGVPAPKTWEEGSKAPLEEAVSDLIPFTIIP